VRTFDWIVLLAALGGAVGYGLWRSRGAKTTEGYLLAGRTMPWYAMALSIMATQASAITFISTTAQSYVDGMRFVQFYFGLPLAMIVIAAFIAPRFHASGVYTAYEYLEKRFDSRTRVVVTAIFLLQRGLGVGIALYAPSIVLTVLLGVPETATILLMGVLAVFYTVKGGIAAVTWADFVQMFIMTLGLVSALATAIWLLPDGIGLSGALKVAGAAGRLNPVTLAFDWNDRYNLWSGLIGGMFLAMAYFGCDQSQVQRYLQGRNITQARLSLLFNAVAKIPMQFFILFTGTMVFAFFTFVKPPVLFNPAAERTVTTEARAVFDRAFEAKSAAARDVLSGQNGAVERFRAAQKDVDQARRHAAGDQDPGDTNYIFLSFVTRYMPVGIVGLVMAVIFAAAMSVISGEINALATVTVIDGYKRFARPEASDQQTLRASRWATAFWGAYAIGTAQFGHKLGSLIEAVNMLGSLFYGGMLGVFLLAFFFPRVNAQGAFWGVLAGEAAIFTVRFTTSVAFLWFNVLGAVVVILVGLAVSRLTGPRNTGVPVNV
jgi:SSS family transporter